VNRTRSIQIETCSILIGFILLGSAIAAHPEPNPEDDQERDVLIDKIARGVEVEASVRRFKELVQKRDQRVATSQAAQDRERADREARRNWYEAWHKSADYEVSWRCTLSPDPANPIPSDEGRYKGDWGRVVRKESLRMTPKNELDEGEPVTIYEIAGLKQHYFVHGEKIGFRRDQPFTAQKGDLVVLCADGANPDRRLPPPWSNEKINSGFAFKATAPPLIAKKKKWNPIHITSSRFYWAVHDVKWKYPDEAFILSVIEIGEDLGGGRYKIEVDKQRGMDWVLEVPPHLAHKELLIPGHYVWAIMGHHRFDKTLKKLVLVAEDLEDRYNFEAQ
jgi:hypothetical protein